MRATLAICVLVPLVGCAPTTWVKPGANENDFSRDRYACLQQSQQRVSTAAVNQFGGSSSSQMETNGGLFRACMNANGWHLQAQERQSQQPQSWASLSAAVSQPKEPARKTVPSPAEKLRESNARYAEAGRDLCGSLQYALVYAKTPCQTSALTAAQLSDPSKATEAEARQLVEHHKSRVAIDRKASEEMYLYGGARGSAMQKAFDDRNARLTVAASRLMQGDITWGQFNTTRQQLQEAFSANMKRISETEY